MQAVSVLKVASIPTFLKVGRGLPPLGHEDTMKGFPLLWYGESKGAKQNASFCSGAWASKYSSGMFAVN